jgi:adenylate cyclase
MRFFSRLPALLFGFAIVAALLTLRGYDPSILSALRGAGFDGLQRLWPRDYGSPQPVRIVDIDEASLRELGQWPWPRTQLAALVDELTELGAATIAFDIVFPEPDRLSPRRLLENASAANTLQMAMPSFDAALLPDNDQVFAAAIAGRPVVTAFASSPGSTGQQAPVKAGFAQTGANATDAPLRLGRITANIPQIDAAAVGVGSINVDLAREQGVARQIPMLWTDGSRLYPSLVVEALRVAQGIDTLLVHAAADTENAIESLVVGEITMPLSESGMFHVYYRPDSPELYVSAASVLSRKERDALRPLIEGHLVFIGTSAVGLLDVRTTALGETVPGVSIHAQAAEQVLSGIFLTRPEWAAGIELLIVLITGAAIIILGSFVQPWLTIISSGFLATGVLGLTVLAFRSYGVLFDATFPMLALAVVFLSSIAFRLFVTDKEGRKLRGAFGHYVAPSVLKEIETNPKALKLGGEIRDVTVMFVDIENFTPLSEKLKPEDLIHVINLLLDACSKAILAEQGTIDKYIGDAVMAFWNAPVAIANHQYRATRAALGIRSAVAALNKQPELASLLLASNAKPLAVRIGLSSGPACVGNMGSSERFDYSVLGETVNIASRAEGACKHIDHDITIAGSITEQTATLATLFAGKVPMKGKTHRQPIHAVMGDVQLASSNEFKQLTSAYLGVTATIGKTRGNNVSAAIKKLLGEVAGLQPEMSKYFKALPRRTEDFRS